MFLRICVFAPVIGFYLFVLLGLIFHSTGTVLGRYSTSSVILIGSLLVLSYPLYRLLMFLTSVTRFTSSKGEELEISVGQKLKPALALVFLLCLGAEFRFIHKATHRKRGQLAKYHPFLQLKGRANRGSLGTNSEGFRGDPIDVAKKPGTLRIFVMGGSTVYCQRTSLEKTHVRLLHKKLEKRYPDKTIEVQNAGIDWYTTQHSLINYLFRIKDFDPDIIILFHGINDLCRSFAPAGLSHGEPKADYSHFYGPVSRIALGTGSKHGLPVPFSIDYLLDDYLYSDLMRSRAVNVEAFRSFPSFVRNLESIIHNMRKDGVKLLLATQPSVYRQDLPAAERANLWMNVQFCEYRGEHPDVSSMARGMAIFNEGMRKVAGQHGVPMVDLETVIPKDGRHFVDDVHYTIDGNALVADQIFKGLLDAKFLERP